MIRFFLLSLIFVWIQGLGNLTSYAQTNETRISLAGDTTTRFHSVFRLSNGTFLVGGEAKSLSWLPQGVPVSELSLPDSTNSFSSSIAFILHVSRDLGSIIRLVRFPANTVRNVFKIKTNTLPGQPTGDIFISGSRENEIVVNGSLFTPESKNRGYYLARLNGNFLNSNVPTGLHFIKDIQTFQVMSNSILGLVLMEVQDRIKEKQPWDVQSDGKIVYARGHSYSARWASINRLMANGKFNDTVFHWPMQRIRVSSSVSEVNGRFSEARGFQGNRIGDSVNVVLPVENQWGNYRIAIDSILESHIVFKVNRSGSDLRSYTMADYNTRSTDENGNPNRFGKYPNDFMYGWPCLSDTCPTTGANETTGYQTNFGNNDNVTQDIGDIVIDRRNNDLFIGYSTLARHNKAKLFESDIEPAVVAFQSNGKLKWWNRLHKEDKSEGSPAAQEVSALAIDYSGGQLVVAAYSYDTCRFNFWKGNEILLNPGGHGFQNQFTGNYHKIRTSWLGKMNLLDGKIRSATYVGDYANDIGPSGSIFQNPVMNGWPDPNTGNPNLSDTRIYGLEVGPNGTVLIRGQATRTITTANAYQRMPKPQQGVAPVNQFVRVYSKGLDSIRYSSSVALIYSPLNPGGTSTIALQSAIYDSLGIVVAGYAKKPEGKLGVIRRPSFGDSLASRKTGLLGLLSPVSDTLGFTTSINGIPPVPCEGTSYPLEVVSAGQVYSWSYPAGWVGSDSGYMPQTNQIVLKTTREAEPGYISVVPKSNGAIGLPVGAGVSRPLPTRVSLLGQIPNGFLKYDLPDGTAAWFVNGDSARLSNGNAIFTSTLNLSQVFPPLNPQDQISARMTNACGTFSTVPFSFTGITNTMGTELDVRIFPNPTDSKIYAEISDPNSLLETSLTSCLGAKKPVRILRKNQGQLIEFDLSELPSGVYVLHFQTLKGRVFKRVLKN